MQRVREETRDWNLTKLPLTVCLQQKLAQQSWTELTPWVTRCQLFLLHVGRHIPGVVTGTWVFGHDIACSFHTVRLSLSLPTPANLVWGEMQKSSEQSSPFVQPSAQIAWLSVPFGSATGSHSFAAASALQSLLLHNCSHQAKQTAGRKKGGKGGEGQDERTGMQFKIAPGCPWFFAPVAWNL